MLISELLRREAEYRDLVADLLLALGRRSLPFAVTGLTDGAADAMLCTLLSDLKGKNKGAVLFLLPEEKECVRLVALLQQYGVRAAFYTARDLTFYHITASHEYEHERLSVLWRLLGGELDVVLTTPDAALGLTVSRERLHSATIHLDANTCIEPTVLAEKLVAAGYTRVELCEGAGQFAVRGGIVDIFAPNLRASTCEGQSLARSAPIRIEFFGDEIDRMGIHIIR